VRFVAPAGTKQFSMRWDPQPGDVVSFKHRGYLFGSKKPKLPTLYRVRSDMEWDDVTQNWKEQTVVVPPGTSKKSAANLLLLKLIFFSIYPQLFLR